MTTINCYGVLRCLTGEIIIMFTSQDRAEKVAELLSSHDDVHCSYYLQYVA